MEYCFSCHGEIDPVTRRCRNCGKLQPAPQTAVPYQAASLHCPVCGASVPVQARFCPNCQHPFNPPMNQAWAPGGQYGAAQPPYPLPPASPAPQGGFAGPAAYPQQPVAVAQKEQIKPGLGESKKAEAQELWPVLASFREKRIIFHALNRPLKVLLGVVGAQIAVVAVLLFAQNWLQPQVSGGVIDSQGITYVVPLATFIVTALSVVAGYWFALAGALRVHWSVCLLVVALGTVVLAITPVTALIVNTHGVGAGIEPFVTEVRLRLVQLGTLVLFWVLALSVLVARQRAKRQTPSPSRTENRGWHSWAFTGVLAILLLYYALEFGVWWTYRQAGRTETGTGFLLQSLGVQAVLLPFFFALLLLLGSADLLEWGEILAETVVFAAWYQRVSWVLLILTPLAALGLIVHVLFVDSSGALLEVGIAAALAGILALLVRFAHIDASWPEWPEKIRSRLIRLGAIFLYLSVTLLSGVLSVVGEARGLLPQFINPLYALVSIPVMLVGLVAGLLLVARGRMGKPVTGALGLFLVMITLLALVASAPAFLRASGLAQVAYPQHFSLLNGIQVIAALGVLAWMIRWFIRRQALGKAAEPLTRAIGPFGGILLLLAGLQIVPWIHDLLVGISTLGSNSTFWLAVLFLATVIWGLITAGEQVKAEDEEGSSFPSEGRALLFFGYTLISTATLLYLGSLHALVNNKIVPAPDTLTTDYVSLGALVLLGPALVVLAFLLKVGRRTPHVEARAPVSSPARTPSARAISWGMFGGGALVIALIVIFVLVSALPQLFRANAQALNQSYLARVPGPNCDTGGAIWTVTPGSPIQTHCLPTELQMDAQPQSQGSVVFIPPSGSFPQNYRVSVSVRFNGSDECASISTRATSAGHYLSDICTDGSWSIKRIDPATTFLASGLVAKAQTYTLEVTTDGSNQRLAINGTGVSTLADAVFASTAVLNLGVANGSHSPSTAFFHAFVFTPLPASSAISPPAIYRTSTPGPRCDQDNGEQWALMSPLSTAIHCLPAGTQMEEQARSRGGVAFTPPGGLFPHNYRASVQIDFSQMPAGCAGFRLRASGANSYGYEVCSDGSWDIGLIQGNQATPFGVSQVARARIYTLEATVDSSGVRLAINGTEVGSHADHTLTTTAFLLMGVANFAQSSGVVVFRDFIVTPLP